MSGVERQPLSLPPYDDDGTAKEWVGRAIRGTTDQEIPHAWTFEALDERDAITFYVGFAARGPKNAVRLPNVVLGVDNFNYFGSSLRQQLVANHADLLDSEGILLMGRTDFRWPVWPSGADPEAPLLAGLPHDKDTGAPIDPSRYIGGKLFVIYPALNYTFDDLTAGQLYADTDFVTQEATYTISRCPDIPAPPLTQDFTISWPESRFLGANTTMIERDVAFLKRAAERFTKIHWLYPVDDPGIEVIRRDIPGCILADDISYRSYESDIVYTSEQYRQGLLNLTRDIFRATGGRWEMLVNPVVQDAVNRIVNFFTP